MIWERYKNFDRRIIKKFLLFPVCINREVRWLEFAKIQQYYHDYYFKSWRNEKFIDE